MSTQSISYKKKQTKKIIKIMEKITVQYVNLSIHTLLFFVINVSISF